MPMIRRPFGFLLPMAIPSDMSPTACIPRPMEPCRLPACMTGWGISSGWRFVFPRSPKSSAKSRILMFQKPPRRFPCSAADPKTNGTRKTAPQFSPPPSAPQRRGFFCQQPLFSFVFLITIFTRIFVAEAGGGTGFSAIFFRGCHIFLPGSSHPQCREFLFADGKEPAENPPALLSLQNPECKTSFRAFISRNFQQNPSLPLPLLRDAGADDMPLPPWPGRHRASP